MGVHRETQLKDYWKTLELQAVNPAHPILRFMTFDRFEQLQSNLRLVSPGRDAYNNQSIQSLEPSSPFFRVNEWSDHIQKASLRLYIPGTCIAVDECIIGYQGRSKETVVIPTKPTPEGFKVWAVAQKGYFLRWIWHTPNAALGPVAKQRSRKRKRAADNNSIALNPTQSVVVTLVNLLPKQTYHVFLDNLFSSPDLFRALRKEGIGATGTCRINCGLYEPFIQAKKDDTKGKCWPWGRIESVPTPDGLVRALVDIFTSISLTNLSLEPLGQPKCVER